MMNNDPLNVCLVAPLPPPNGGITRWTDLVRKYAQARTDVKLDIVDTSPHWRAIDDLAVWKRALGGGLQLLRDYARVMRVMHSRPDAIHLTTSGQLAVVRDLAILATARQMGIPAVYHLHFGRLAEIARENSSEWRLLARAIRMARSVVAIDPGTEVAIAHHLPEIRVLRIPNGVDLKALPANTPASSPTVLYLGHVIPSKGLSELVQAWAGVSIEGWKCLVAGAGSEIYRRELLDRFSPEHMEFLSEQSHANAMFLLAKADVLVLASHTEGFPNVIIEAMAMGKAIVATSVGAIPEMLAGDCGVLVPPRDVNALREGLHRILSDANLRTAVGVRARSKARTEYAMDRVLEQLVAAWREAVS